MSCNNGCAIPQFASIASSTPPTPAPACPTNTTGPCKPPSYARACLSGDPTSSPLRLQRQARAEHLWNREITHVVTADEAGLHSMLDVLFPAFTSSGSACLKGVTFFYDAAPVVVSIVGIAGVWDFTSPSPDWTTRVSIPCEKIALEISVTSGRCACDIDCEGCLYPAGVGGLFMVRVRFPQINFAAGRSFTLQANGTHNATPACCLMPELLDELAPVAGPYPAVQALV